ncbi:hypothetical protein [Nonomuraea sp. NPDC050643]|uniref:hypothetical protein n=1 Tax=Nonomuraea sp. NPDC050643 TaxID=3155660 RepID=UPI003405784D
MDLSGSVRGTRAGLAVVNNAKHGYDVSPASPGRAPSIGITAVRSPVHAWHDPRLLDPDGYYSYQDQGTQRFSYLLVPHAGDWRAAGLTRRAALLGAGDARKLPRRPAARLARPPGRRRRPGHGHRGQAARGRAA